MTKGEACNWLRNLRADIGKIEHQDLWHYEQALEEIMELITNTAVSNAVVPMQSFMQTLEKSRIKPYSDAERKETDRRILEILEKKRVSHGAERKEE